MVWKAFLSFCEACQSSQVAFIFLYESKWFSRYFFLFFTLLSLLGFAWKKRSLEHGKTWFGRCSTCFIFFLVFTTCVVFCMCPKHDRICSEKGEEKAEKGSKCLPRSRKIKSKHRPNPGVYKLCWSRCSQKRCDMPLTSGYVILESVAIFQFVARALHT